MNMPPVPFEVRRSWNPFGSHRSEGAILTDTGHGFKRTVGAFDVVRVQRVEHVGFHVPALSIDVEACGWAPHLKEEAGDLCSKLKHVRLNTESSD